MVAVTALLTVKTKSKAHIEVKRTILKMVTSCCGGS